MIDHETPTHLETAGTSIALPSAGAVGLLAGTSYRLVRLLGEGAMGEVWEAEHIGLRRRAVVKLIRREYAWTEGFLERLGLEGRALAAITPHPHIVGVSDLGETSDGRGFLVMELLTGRTLRQELLARGSFPVADAVKLGLQLLDGLSAAHRAGILHRDIKLDNLFLCDGPRAGEYTLKILDFGIAKVISANGDANAAELPQQLTRQGVALGTPRLMSPEQAQGGTLDPRADLYSTGIVLYMLLTGQDPFQHHKGTFSVLKAQAEEIPRPPSAVALQPISAALDGAILRALEKRPADRFESAEAFMVELSRAADPDFATSWAETEPLDVSMFRRSRELVAPSVPSPPSSQPTAADEPTCAITTADMWGESPAKARDLVRLPDRSTLWMAFASLFVAFVVGGLLWRVIMAAPQFR